MNQQKEIYAPSLHLFAFMTVKGIDPDFQTFPSDFEKQVQQWLIDKYLLVLQKVFKDYSPEDIAKKIQLNPHPNSKFILANNYPYRLIKQEEFPHIANISPQKLGNNDTYAFNLSLETKEEFGKDGIKIEQLKKFNPDKCLNIKTNLGKIIILTAFISESQKQNLDDIQKQCFNAIFPLEEESQPKFYSKDKIFNSEVFIYGNPRHKQERESYQQIWFIFFTKQENRRNFENIYFDLPTLFLEFHKIVNDFHLGKKEYQQADEEIQQFGNILKDVKEKYRLENDNNEKLPTIDLDSLKHQLKTILTRSLRFSEKARKLELHQNYLGVNLYNYNQSCQQLQIKINKELLLLNSFANREFTAFEKEIQSNIKYISQGSLLIQEAVSTIRGLIEIDQAESDRQLVAKKEQELQAQAERDKNLEITLTALGFGIGVGGIIASSSGQVTSDNPISILPKQVQNGEIHPFYFFVFISICGGLATGILFLILANLRRKMWAKFPKK